MSDDRRWLLALDTATNTVVVAAGEMDGALLGVETTHGRYRHSQELLPAVARLVERLGLKVADVGGIVAGTGPGAFTGLRVGLATAKTLAHELGVPVAGVGIAEAVLATQPAESVLWLPSGPRDRVAITRGHPPAILGTDDAPPRRPDADAASEAVDLAIDLDGRASDAAIERGRQALERLPETLLRLGADRIRAGDTDDPERLVPEYASPPRGASPKQAEGGVAWSRDPR